jgi:radical SAM superfamily enzyme YgiQ (UPF0313 family)
MTPSRQDARCDILLIQPPIRDFYLTAKRTIPYGLASIAAGLIEAGLSVEIVDALATPKSRVTDLPAELSYLQPYYGQPDQSPFGLFHHFKHFGYSYDTIGQRVKKTRPFLVGISSLFTAYAAQALETAQIVRRHHPECKIVLGGHHPTALPERIMESPAVDFVLRGEGEVSMPMLARALQNGACFDDIPGLVYRKADGGLHVNEPARMHDPDDYPLPAIHLLNQRFYRRHKKASAVIVASRGCPMKCTYCAVGASSPFNHRRRSVESVLLEIENAVNLYDAGFIDFEDENLSLDRAWFLQLLNQIHRRFEGHPLELRAMNGLLPSSLDEQIIGAMKAAGFKTLNLSLGTTASAQLKRFQRPDVRSAFEKALALAEIHDLQAVGYIIVGAPFQKAADSLNDILYLAERRVLVGTSVFYPAPGSRDYALCASLGLLPRDFSGMRASALPICHATTRKETATLLRLSRIVNFMKHLIDDGQRIPDPLPANGRIANPQQRKLAGKLLLRFFLNDGIIRGVNLNGAVFEHITSVQLSNQFLAGIAANRIRGCQS